MSREAFEAWAKDKHCLTYSAWEAWQAAQADAYERAAKACLDMANERPRTGRSERACSSRNHRAAQCHDAIRALAKEAGK